MKIQVDRTHTAYLLHNRERWARAYAQYITQEW